MALPKDLPEEAARVAIVEAMRHVDEPLQRKLDDITVQAARLFGMPMAAIMLVGANASIHLAYYGFDLVQVGRETAFSSYTILTGGILCAENATEHPDFRDNPYVVGPPQVRAYIGAPIAPLDNIRIGALSAADVKPRTFSSIECFMMRQMAMQVERVLRPHLRKFPSGIKTS